MTYALGRRVEYTDMPAIRAIVRDAAKKDNQHVGVRPGRGQQPGVQDERRPIPARPNGARPTSRADSGASHEFEPSR